MEAVVKAEKDRVKHNCSENIFKFRDGRKIKNYSKSMIPATIFTKNVFIETDVFDEDIILLLSKETMKNTGTGIGCINDKASLLGQKQNLVITTAYTVDRVLILHKHKDNNTQHTQGLID